MVLWNSQGPTGRERAIESLIDREPHGNYYRAARVVDEAVPAALGSRPNLVTKTALVEQAFLLSQHDVDTVDKYEHEAEMSVSPSSEAITATETATDATATPTPTSTTTKTTLTGMNMMDAVAQERVLRHCAKLGAATSTGTSSTQNTNTPVAVCPTSTNANTTGSLQPTPPPALLAALRQIYDKDGTSSGSGTQSRLLLEKIMNHAVFLPNRGAKAGGKGSSSSIHSPTGDDATEVDMESSVQMQETATAGQPWQANLEALIANLAKMRQEKGNGDREGKLLQGLLIAVMGVLTEQEEAPPPSPSHADPKSRQRRGHHHHNHNATTSAQQQRPPQGGNDDPVQPFLQVASALYLMPCDNIDSNNSSATSTTTPFDLDASLLEYFGQAASSYEERLEIQTLRNAARMAAHVHTTTTTTTTDTTTGTTTDAADAAETPTRVVVTVDPENSNNNNNESSPPALIRRTRSIDEDDDEDDDDDDDDDSSVDEDDEDLDEDDLDGQPVLRTPRGSPHEDLQDLDHELEAMPVMGGESGSGDDSDPHAALAEARVVVDAISASEAAEAALNAAFEQIIASGTMGAQDDDDDDEDEDIEQDSSESDSDEEGDGRAYREHTSNENDPRAQEPQPDEDGNEDDDDSSDSSSSSSSGGEPMLESERGLDTDDEDDPVMRQSLAMSMAQRGEGVAALALDTPGTGTHNSVDSVRVIVQEGPGADEEETAPSISAAASGDNPVSCSNSGSVEDDDGLSDAGVDDESYLPPLPLPPSTYPFASLVGLEASVLADSDADALPSRKSLASYFDPAAFSQFGSLPTCHVLVHLLKYTAMLVERRRFGKPKDEQEGSGVPPGGMGSSLFTTPRRGHGRGGRSSSSTTTSSKTGSDSSSDDVTLQLLVACFLLCVNKRHDAIENLRKAIAREQRVVQGDAFGSDGDGDDNNDSGMPLSEEEDDPAAALTLAMNYVEDDVPLSSDSLENKGMRRKAAAAAHDAAALLKSLRKRTDAWKDRVKLYSYCTVSAAKSLRQFLQFIVRRWLEARVDGKGSCISVVDFHKFLPPLVTSNLTDALASLTSVTTQSSYVTMLGGDVSETQELFLSCKLYQEAIGTWAECVPLVYPSESAQADILRSLLKDCSPSRFQGSVPLFQSVDSLSAFPSSDLEPQIHRLEAVCRRLRVSDLLDSFVSGPAVYFPESDPTLSEVDEGDIAKIPVDSGDPRRPSSLIAVIGKSLSSLVGAKEEAQRLYLALCHRCHARMILFDGLYATTETETEDSIASSLASKSLSTGDTVRVSTTPSSGLQFDTMKCSDSIAVLSGNRDSSPSDGNGSSVLQRASKVWGSVLSSHHYSPKTGVHRWAVKLDKCERGHVFVGVATTQASMRTYVGGDKYGWGMIGTQALWHDRRKIRGDYGATFRTGSTIIVTLDTDAGTLSFSTWKDTNGSGSDALVQNLLSPRRQGHVGGTIEDWGVAFEGLPLDSRLYPAVGLYQRDDRVTLLTVERSSRVSGRVGSMSVISGECYFPRPGTAEEALVTSEEAARVRRFNDLLSWDSVQYVADILHYVVESLQSGDDFALTTLIPSLAASLCLVPPSVPVLSSRFALDLMPHLSRCISELERLRDKQQTVHHLFASGLKKGKWVIRATGSSGSSGDFEEYVVDFTTTSNSEGSILGFEGTGVGTTGKSKNGLVAICGAVKGSSVHFVEEWSDGTDEGFSSSGNDDASSCVVAARLGLDGKRFEGVYRNVHFGTSGHIVGMRREESTTSSKLNLKDAPASSKQNAESSAAWATAQAVLCLAHSHLATIVGEDVAGDIVHQSKSPTDSSTSPSEWAVRHETLRSFFSRPILSTCSLNLSNGSLEQDVEYLKKLYCPPDASKDLRGIDNSRLLDRALRGKGGDLIDAGSRTLLVESEIGEQIAAVDDNNSHLFGGKGSLSILCPSEYSSSRKRIIHALLYHCRMVDKLSSVSVDEAVPSDLVSELEPFWRASLRVMEDGVRNALSKSRDQSKLQAATNVCKLHDKISDFLLGLERPPHCGLTIQEASKEFVWFYGAIESEYDLQYLRGEMSCASRRGLMRLIAFQDAVDLLSDKVDNAAAVESLVVGLPRLLGRGQGDTATNLRKYAESKSGDGVPDLDGNYLAGLSGSSSWVRGALRSNVRALFRTLGRVIERAVSRRSDNESLECRVSTDSLVLSILAVFVGNIRKDDLDDVVVESDILTILPKIFSAHRFAVLEDVVEGKDDEEAFVVKKLQTICRRDLSRAILRCSTAAAHVIIYQAVSRDTLSPGEVKTASLCLAMLLGELAVTFPFLEHATGTGIAATVSKRADEDWERWYESCYTKSKSTSTAQKKVPGGKVGSSGIQYLQEHGTTLNVVVQATPQKQSSRQKGPTGAQRSSPDNSTKGKAGFSNHYLTHWLHALCTVLRPSGSLAVIKTDSRWLHILLKVVGLSVDQRDNGSVLSVDLRSRESGFLPARFRARILRLVLPLLTSLEPSQPILEGLFSLAGAGVAVVTRSVDEEESLVSREAVSLLRHLHSPTRPLWRASVNRSIAACIDSDAGNTSGFYTKMGVLSFFSGSLEGVGRGSYVLLKPAAAVPLSAEHQSAPSSKSNSSAIGGGATSATAVGAAPHHVVGNGTESVVAGLCRSEASAGIVSSIDMKNGICEVILVSRYQEDSEMQSSVLETPNRAASGSSERRSSGGRHVLTVRALRTPLTDVVLAQEVPLYLDDSIPVDKLVGSMLWSSVDSLLSAVVPGETDKSEASEGTQSGEATEGDAVETTPKASENSLRSGVLSLSSDLMTVRCCMVVLSDKKILSIFLDQDLFKGRLSKLLSLAWPERMDSEGISEHVQSSRSKFLSSLPIHEARYGHLVSLLKDVGLRMQILNQTSESEWERRLEKFATRQQERDETSGESEGANVQASGSISLSASPRTPPALAGSFIGRTRSEMSAASRDTDSHSNRSISQSTGGSNSEDEEESEAATTAASHLREAAIAQMAELGLPRSWSELALRRTGTNIEAAVHFCLERGGEMERLIAEERERDRITQRESSSSSTRRRGNSDTGTTNHLRRQLLEMGFPSRWCTEALTATGNNVDEALTWILTNGERLSEEDEAMEADDDGENDGHDDDNDSLEDDEDEDETEDGESASQRPEEPALAEKGGETSDAKRKNPPSTEQEPLAWTGSIVPLRFISGRSTINANTMEITGLPTGGFSSVGTKGVLLTSGKWYYEAILETAGCLQIGWADGSFAGHCHAERGDGCGDGPSSWAFDGWRRYRWHSTATEWGCRWREGDVVGCLVDMDEHIVSFTLNGEGESIGMGRAFSGEGFRPCGGVYACVSFNRREKLRMILGGSGSEPFKYQPPPGYRGVGEAVLEAVEERNLLLEKENVLGPESIEDGSKRFLCDFSDGEHGHELMAWAHRYYGSDASVHLGSGRSKQATGVPKGSPAASSVDAASSYVTRRLEKAWSAEENTPSSEHTLEREQVLSEMKSGFENVQSELAFEVFNECIVMAILLSRKLILHLMMTLGKDFDAGLFAGAGSELVDIRRFWNVVEACGSLRSAGWVGEAGAMAVAAEALGLGISSNDQVQSRHSSERSGVVSATDLDDGLYLPTGGISQVLSTALGASFVGGAGDTSTLLAASAEAAIGGDAGGGVLAFLKESLQSAVLRSETFRKVLLAAVWRSVRQLAVVEYDGDDSDLADGQEEEEDLERISNAFGRQPGGTAAKTEDRERLDSLSQPDARLTCFFSGLLLSHPVRTAVEDFEEIQADLFGAWSVGLLSASLPWRMICSFTAAGILNQNPLVLSKALQLSPTLARFYGRLQSTVARRVWAERAAVPVCSRYVQALVELLASVKRSVPLAPGLPREFSRFWGVYNVDAATPVPLEALLQDPSHSSESFWESEDGWVSSDSGWEIYSGTVEYKAVDWKTPSRSAVRTLMDGGEGPPMLREGCIVMRGPDWDDAASEAKESNEDGRELYESEKTKREQEKRLLEDQDKDTTTAAPDAEAKHGVKPEDVKSGEHADPADETQCDNPAEPSDAPESETTRHEESSGIESAATPKKKKKKIPSPKLPVGTVLSIEPWNGIPALGRRVRWHLTGTEGIYRYGGDGGRYDVSHVETNEKQTRVKKRHPVPESAEQCAARHGFGVRKTYSVLLRLKRNGEKDVIDGQIAYRQEGVLEWPDFGAGVHASCTLHEDGRVTLVEKELLFGSKDSGWEARFGQASFVSGSVIVLEPIGMESISSQAELDIKSSSLSQYEELVGTTTFDVVELRNRDGGTKLQVASEMRLLRGRRTSDDEIPPSIQALPPQPIHFDREYHASSLSLSRDGKTVSCVASDGRGTAFGSMGFTKGVHYWEVKLEQADIGSVFIGVAEKPSGSGSGSSFGHDTPPRLNRWHGWGFVNFRATYTSGAERVYGAHCHAGDTVGVLLDCDAGRVSFFFDGLKYGEHILNDLGCAFENLSPFGFNVDGCGSGGAGQGAPSGFEGGRGGRYPAQGTVQPRALWPVIGLRNQGDRVTFSSKWSTSYGVDGVTTVDNILAVDQILSTYVDHGSTKTEAGKHTFPSWFVREAFTEFKRWNSDRWLRSATRGSGPYRLASFGLDVDMDASPKACAAASAGIGLKYALLAGDRVRLTRSAGRILELAEEAVVVGAFQGRLYYRIVSQKSEGGSLTEGGGRAWCWDESEVVDGLPFVSAGKGLNVALPILNRFRCLSPGGLRIVYEGGAVLRSDLEIFDGSANLGTIPVNAIIPRADVLERRVNSCGVVRYRVRYEEIGEGWISARIRGGKEDPIIETFNASDSEAEDADEASFLTALDCASVWFDRWQELAAKGAKIEELDIDDLETFEELVASALVPGYTIPDSDSLLSAAVSAISNYCEGGDALECRFREVAGALSFALGSSNIEDRLEISGANPTANQAAATVFAGVQSQLPALRAVMARVALIRAFNRRARLALPWLSIRPSQEGSAILGGLCGYGTSADRAGRSLLTEAEDTWVQVPSIATRIRSFRSLFFTSVKRGLLLSITEATTTPTPLSHDEYELPREIRTVRINRLKAARAMSSDDPNAKRKYSVFAQLHNETKNWGGAALRRGYVAKGHGGQKRAFKVKLIGEGVNDYSGPYREAFTDALSEVVKTDDKGRGSLGVLDPTPNNASAIGDNRELYMFSLNGRDLSLSGSATSSVATVADEEARLRQHFGSLMAARDEASREVEEALVFLGRITGTAYRHGIPVDLPLPIQSVWKALVEQVTPRTDRLRELDHLACRQLEDKRDPSPLLWWQQRMLNSFVEGLSNVLPVEVLPILSAEELRDIFCGNPDVDVDLLKCVVEYEGYEDTDAVIGYFWETLREITNDERKKFLQFVWARNRLPMRESDFEAPFKIQKDSVFTGDRADQALPSASTCFFSLTLPEYTSQKTLKDKLLFAISNVTTMETDFQTNSAEISEGYRAF